jgi:hypothetical protein
VRAARSCAGSGRREQSREGRAAMSRHDEGIASMIACNSTIREVGGNALQILNHFQWTSKNGRPRVWTGTIIATSRHRSRRKRAVVIHMGPGAVVMQNDGVRRDADTKPNQTWCCLRRLASSLPWMPAPVTLDCEEHRSLERGINVVARATYYVAWTTT